MHFMPSAGKQTLICSFLVQSPPYTELSLCNDPTLFQADLIYISVAMLCKAGCICSSTLITVPQIKQFMSHFIEWVLDSLAGLACGSDLQSKSVLDPDKQISWLSEGGSHVCSLHTVSFIGSIKTSMCRAVIHSRIVWHQAFAAKLGQKQEPGSVVSCPFWSHHKLPLHERGGKAARVLFYHIPSPSVPVCTYTHSHRSVSFVFSVLCPRE